MLTFKQKMMCMGVGASVLPALALAAFFLRETPETPMQKLERVASDINSGILSPPEMYMMYPPTPEQIDQLCVNALPGKLAELLAAEDPKIRMTAEYFRWLRLKHCPEKVNY